MVADHEVRARPVPPVTDRIQVPFAGEGAGTAELSWGQQELWLTMQRRKVWIPLASVTPLPDGATVDSVAARLRFMMARYPTLRTRLRFDPDGTRQVVADRGEIPLEIVDAAADADPRLVADRFSLHYMDRDYDFVTEWPVRVAVLRHRGVLRYQVTVMSHLVLDGTGAALMAAELAAGGDPDAAGDVPPSPTPPLEQARRQRSPVDRRHSDAALRYWEGLLQAAPPRRFGPLGGLHRPRYWKGHLNSRATLLAVESIAARTRVDSSAVLLALYAVALARLTGVSPVLLEVMVSNRFRRGFAGTVSPVFQPGLCLIEVADSTIDAVITGAGRRVMAAYKHAYYDPRQRDELAARISRERGQRIELGCYVNDRRRRDRPAAAEPTESGGDPTPAQLPALLPASSFEWTVMEDIEFTDPAYLFIDDVGDPPEAVALTLSADTRCLLPAQIEAVVRGIEVAAVEAACDPAAGTGVNRRG